MSGVRTTVYFDPKVLQALKIRGIELKKSVSSLTNQAVKMQVLEDYEDIKSFEERENEETLSFTSFLESLKENAEI